jgi:PXA domain
MTSVPTLRPPLQPTSKAASTAQSSQLLAVAGNTPVVSRASSQARQSRPVRREVSSNDFLSEKSTVSLIRRVLVADGAETRSTPQPIEAVLPPLTSSNDVDIQLYAIIAIVIKDFINPWYSKITPDHAFVDEVIQIIAHCTRAIEQRLRLIDVVELILDEIPALVQQHIKGEYKDFRKNASGLTPDGSISGSE